MACARDTARDAGVTTTYTLANGRTANDTGTGVGNCWAGWGGFGWAGGGAPRPTRPEEFWLGGSWGVSGRFDYFDAILKKNILERVFRRSDTDLFCLLFKIVERCFAKTSCLKRKQRQSLTYRSCLSHLRARCSENLKKFLELI